MRARAALPSIPGLYLSKSIVVFELVESPLCLKGKLCLMQHNFCTSEIRSVNGSQTASAPLLVTLWFILFAVGSLKTINDMKVT